MSVVLGVFSMADLLFKFFAGRLQNVSAQLAEDHTTRRFPTYAWIHAHHQAFMTQIAAGNFGERSAHISSGSLQIEGAKLSLAS